MGKDSSRTRIYAATIRNPRSGLVAHGPKLTHTGATPMSQDTGNS